uniref:hypothetical protein n=1 Tax=Corallococcus coralloides TaxID=184914 RepID=UPI001F0CDD3F|nr:hypothetical protein [Corallococcus coralloides]
MSDSGFGSSTLALALVGSAVTVLSTSLGAVPALAMGGISQRTKDVLMGFSAGVMLAATAFSLVVPAIHLAEERSTSRFVPALVVGGSMLGGACSCTCATASSRTSTSSRARRATRRRRT